MLGKYQRLVELLPPPQGVAALPWAGIADEISLQLPSDYKWFCDTYGGGEISKPMDSERGAWFEIFSPSQVGHGDLAGGLQGLIDYHMRDFYEVFGLVDADDRVMWAGDPRPVYPEPGGVLGWGQSEWGDVFFWLTIDPNPDKWPVVVWMRHVGAPVYLECGMVEFLVRLFQGEFEMDSWLAPGLQWTMQNDWLRAGLEITAGPARE